MQAPRMLIGGGRTRADLHERMATVEAHLRKAVEARHPVCLSDSSATTCEVQTQLRQGRVHCLVWCGRGHGCG